jgi:hypothetical protein
VLELLVLWLREFPHQKAEPITGSVNTGCHVVFAFGRDLQEFEAGFFAPELFYKSVLLDVALGSHIENKLVGFGCSAWMEECWEIGFP